MKIDRAIGISPIDEIVNMSDCLIGRKLNKFQIFCLSSFIWGALAFLGEGSLKRLHM